jgi:hypothetical protein
MADISDVEQALADSVTLILYPDGATQSSIVGSLCRIYRGWPNSATLNADLSAGVVNITIVTDNESGHTTTRYLPKWESVISEPGAEIATADQMITVSGSPTVGDVVGALIDGSAYAYRIKPGDTVDLVASNLDQLIQSGRSATTQGATITIPGAGSVKVRVVSDSSASFESRRQEKNIRIICWCPTPPIRDAVAAAIDSALDQISFLNVSDESKARVIYRNTESYDQAQNALLYRRDLVYMVEYATITTFMQPSMLFGASAINGNIKYG